ncbi:hypothetical protein E2C01_052371 [Portunus trituberculatus]|uniref:Uncharacterized protein n=1 Tax=Portunus trituberculatus TaxID=210409 RepID=A0A5B7GLD4_PORTR|nr:hypothetical protein [Portunus trituberculatus]
MEAQFLKTIGGTPSGPEVLQGFRPARAWKTSLKELQLRRGRSKPRIIQGGVVSKGLREEFSF